VVMRHFGHVYVDGQEILSEDSRSRYDSLSVPSRAGVCKPTWVAFGMSCVRANISETTEDFFMEGCLLLAAYMKVARQNRTVTSLMTSRDPMTS